MGYRFHDHGFEYKILVAGGLQGSVNDVVDDLVVFGLQRACLLAVENLLDGAVEVKEGRPFGRGGVDELGEVGGFEPDLDELSDGGGVPGE